MSRKIGVESVNFFTKNFEKGGFIDRWMPPNDWGCKCRVRQVAKPDKFIEPPTDIKQPPAVMQNNPGKTGKAFTDGHPMIKQMSNTTKAEIEREFKTLYRRIIESAFISIFKNKKIKTNDGLVVTLSSVSFRKISSNDDYFHTIKHILVKKNHYCPIKIKSSNFIYQKY